MNFDDYLSKVSSEDFISKSSAQLKQPDSVIQQKIRTYANEARYGYNLIEPYLDKNKRILEVGAGIGVLSAYLHLCGYQVIAIEPSGKGFDLNNQVGQQLKNWLEIDEFDFLDMGIEDLDRSSINKFDIIFSFNVVEHLPDLNIAFAHMKQVLSTSGIMIHTCPNYHVPYEPHFSIPLIPVFPSATRYLIANRIAKSDLWQSLNFVTSSRMKRIARKQELKIEFEPRTIYRSLMRLGEDPMFAKRHNVMIIRIFHFLRITKLIHLFRFCPAMLSTPMNFTCKHKNLP